MGRGAPFARPAYQWLDSSIVHGGLVDLLTTARGIDLNAAGITGFQHLYTQHHRRSFARAQVGLVSRFANTRPNEDSDQGIRELNGWCQVVRVQLEP